MPHEIISALFKRFFPKLERQLPRTVTIPRTQTITSHNGPASPGTKVVSYISFDAVVGRNSAFHQLITSATSDRALTYKSFVKQLENVQAPSGATEERLTVRDIESHAVVSALISTRCSANFYALSMRM